MEVIFQDNIGFLYDVCRVVICKSNKRESWINAFLCDGSEEEDMLYIDSLLKKFQKIEFSSNLLGYKSSLTRNALIGEMYVDFLKKNGSEITIEAFVEYITSLKVLWRSIAEYYLDVSYTDKAEILNVIRSCNLNSDVKSELYSFFLFTEEYIQDLKKGFHETITVMQNIYRESDQENLQQMKERFDVQSFFLSLQEYAKPDEWEKNIVRCIVSFSLINPYLITRQLDQSQDGILILGKKYELFFVSKSKEIIDLVSFGNALGDKIRMKMLWLLHENGELTLTEFSKKLDIVNAVALYHIEILKEAKLIFRRNKGKNVLYWLNDKQFLKAIKEINKLIGGGTNEKLEKTCLCSDQGRTCK